jgi:hypothetical protein
VKGQQATVQGGSSMGLAAYFCRSKASVISFDHRYGKWPMPSSTSPRPGSLRNWRFESFSGEKVCEKVVSTPLRTDESTQSIIALIFKSLLSDIELRTVLWVQKPWGTESLGLILNVQWILALPRRIWLKVGFHKINPLGHDANEARLADCCSGVCEVEVAVKICLRSIPVGRRAPAGGQAAASFPWAKPKQNTAPTGATI